MALSRVIYEIFNVEKCRDLEILVRGHSKSLKVILYHSIDWVWFLLVFCSNFVPERHLTCKTTQALKTRLGVTQGHQNRHGSIRRLWLSINVHSNHGFMSYHFWDEQWFQPKIANFPTPVFCAPAERVPLEWGIGAGIQKKLEWCAEQKVWRYLQPCDRRTDRHRTTAKTAIYSLGHRLCAPFLQLRLGQLSLLPSVGQ